MLFLPTNHYVRHNDLIIRKLVFEKKEQLNRYGVRTGLANCNILIIIWSFLFGAYTDNYFVILASSELDEEMQSAVRDYLEQRGVNDELAAFLHAYMENKEHAELIRWLKNIELHVKN